MIFNKKNFKDLSLLSTSEGLSLLIVFLTLPFISRIYDPADFGNFEKYVVVVGIVANLCLLNFEFKIYNFSTKKDQTLSIVTCLIFTMLFSSLFFCFGFIVTNFLTSNLLFSFEIVFLVFLWLVFVSFANITLSYFSSFGNFKKYSIIRLFSTLVLVCTQIILGLLEFKFYGFIYAIIFQNIFISIFGFFPIYKQTICFVNQFSFKDVFKHIKNNKYIVMFTFPGSLVNRLTQSLPIFFLASFNPIYLGYYSFGSQLLNYPLKLFNGLSNMFKKEFNDEIRINKTYRETFNKYLKVFSIISILLLTGTLFLSDIIVPFIFGEKWTQAIPIIKILSIMVCIRFIVGSLSPVLLIGNLPRYDIVFQLLYLILSLLFIIIGKEIFNSYLAIIISYIISSIIFYIFYFFVMRFFSKRTFKI